MSGKKIRQQPQVEWTLVLLAIGGLLPCLKKMGAPLRPPGCLPWQVIAHWYWPCL
jgi:hypothetical protein